MCIGLMRVFDIGIAFDMKFMHAHYNLLGFMSMMIMGIAYHIMPRFNGVNIYFPRWIPYHFWCSNIGLFLLTTGFHFRALDYMKGFGNVIFVGGGILSGIGISLFVINLLFTLLSKPKPMN